MTEGAVTGEAAEQAPLLVVGVGSSAGGIAALSEFVSGLVPGARICYVLAQHMGSHTASHLAAILADHTQLPVHEAEDGTLLQPDTVVLAPPGTDVKVAGNRIHLGPVDHTGGPRPSVDGLLESLANSWGSRSVAVLLSGTGTDGRRGAQAVAAVGGWVVAQNPASAGFPDMPQAALDCGPDTVMLEAAEIGRHLGERVGLPIQDREPGQEPAPAQTDVAHEQLTAILEEVRAATGIDFTGYKRPTVARQVSRRMSTVGLADLASYRAMIAADPREARALAHALMVTVTSFFRDPESWGALETLLAESLAHGENREQLRIWVPGCATGEEAYTAAIVACRVLGYPTEPEARIKVFATDLNEESLDVARQGRYPQQSGDAIPTAVRKRFLTSVPDGWEVKPELRRCIVFARHNVAFDPPFPNIDVVCLRNTIIYLQPHLRERVLRLCHFSLVPGGLLMLGNSERLDHDEALFRVIDGEHHIAQRTQADAGGLPPSQPVTIPAYPPLRVQAPQPTNPDQSALLRAFAPPTLVLDAGDRVIEIIGDVRGWCRIADGRYSNHFGSLVDPALAPVVTALLLQVRRGGRAIAEADAVHDGSPLRVAVRAIPGGQDGLAAVSFTSPGDGGFSGPRTAGQDPHDSSQDASNSDLVGQLTATQNALQVTVADLTEANEGMRVLNEELQASSEELQASSEELQASNEELAATNEELTTLNTELSVRGDLLSQANTDLQNIQASLTSGMILVDRQLRILRYTPLAVRAFALIPSDVGRQITAVPASVLIENLEGMLEAAVQGSNSEMVEVHSAESDVLVHTQPYVGAEGDVLGAIIVVTDISELTAARRVNARTLLDLELVMEGVREAVWLRHPGGPIRVLSRRAAALFAVDHEAALADPTLLYSRLHPEDRERLTGLETNLTSPRQVSVRVMDPDGGQRWAEVYLAPVAPLIGEPDLIVVSAQDVTQARELSKRAQERERLLTTMLDNQTVGLITLDRDNRIQSANRAVASMLDYSPATLVGTPLNLLIDSRPTGEPDETAPGGMSATGPRPQVMRASDGSSRFVTVEVIAIPDSEMVAGLAIVHDMGIARTRREVATVQVIFDPQTGALSRAPFHEAVRSTLGRTSDGGAGVALMWIDIDGFRGINEQYGHEVGDAVLAHVASRLRDTAGVGCPTGRLGADEFAVLIPEVATPQALQELAAAWSLGARPSWSRCLARPNAGGTSELVGKPAAGAPLSHTMPKR